MKIVHVMLSKNFSGAERHVVELAAAQAEQHEVHVILHRKAFGNRANAIGHRFAPTVHVHKVSAPIRQWAFWQVRQRLRTLNPDIVHSHLKAAAKAVKGSRIAGKCIATLHIDYDPKQHEHMDALIAITPQQQQRVAARSKVPCVQIDNWVAGEAATVEAAQSLRQRYGIDDDCIVIGSLGRVEESKGHGLLIEAVQPLLSDKVKLAIVGTGRLHAELKTAHPEVIMPGYSVEAKAWMRGFDVFVSAANYEPFGLVFLEAMQAGTPVVATATEGASHLAPALGIEPVAVDDLAGLRAAIAAELAQAPRRVDYDAEAFSVAQKVAEVDALYQQVTNCS